MKKLTALIAAGVMSMLGSTLVHALPIDAGSFTLDGSTTNYPVQIFDVNAIGYSNLTLAFSATGGGSIDPCDGSWYYDCLSVSTEDTDLLSDLSISTQLQHFGPVDLDISNSVFNLIFDARITGVHEYMTVDWSISGDLMQELSVLAVSEPGLLVLLSLGGLLGFTAIRRRSA